MLLKKTGNTSSLSNVEFSVRNEILNEILNTYSLSPLDSMFLELQILGEKLNLKSFISSQQTEKQFIFIYSIYALKGGVQAFLSEVEKYNIEINFSIVKKGSFNLKNSPLAFKNRIKGFKMIEPYSNIYLKSLPRKIKFSKGEKLKRNLLQDYKLLYIPTLSNCIW